LLILLILLELLLDQLLRSLVLLLKRWEIFIGDSSIVTWRGRVETVVAIVVAIRSYNISEVMLFF